MVNELAVPDAQLRLRDAAEKLRVERLENGGIVRLVQRLAVEQVNDRVDRVDLVGLLGVELELHFSVGFSKSPGNLSSGRSRSVRFPRGGRGTVSR